MSDVEFVMTESRASPGIEPGVRRLKVSHLSNVLYCTVPTPVCLFIYNIFSVRIICGPLSWRDDRLTGHGTSEKANSYYSYSYTASQIQHGSVRLYRTSVLRTPRYNILVQYSYSYVMTAKYIFDIFSTIYGFSRFDAPNVNPYYLLLLFGKCCLDATSRCRRLVESTCPM